MPPNWKLVQEKCKAMHNSILGNEAITITTPNDVTYDFKTGESTGGNTVEHIKCLLETPDKSDLIDLEEGLREKSIKFILSDNPINKRSKIVTDFDNTEYEVVVKSEPTRAGGYTMGYKTVVAKVENSENG